jgi:hypothetical protein
VGRSILRLRLYVSISEVSREKNVANVYIETRPKARREEAPIEDYVVEDHSNHVLATFKTQREAIDWAIKNGHTPW